MPLRRPLSAPSYTPPPAPSQPQHYACSWCAAPWTDDHAAQCTHRPLSEAQVAAAVSAGMEGPLAQAYATGARDALARLKASLGPEHADLVDALAADYGE